MMSDEEENEQIIKKIKKEVENEQIIKKYRDILDMDEKHPFLAPIDKLHIMKNLCDLKDEKACQILGEVVPELRRQAENEDNIVAKNMLNKIRW